MFFTFHVLINCTFYTELPKLTIKKSLSSVKKQIHTQTNIQKFERNKKKLTRELMMQDKSCYKVLS